MIRVFKSEWAEFFIDSIKSSVSQKLFMIQEVKVYFLTKKVSSVHLNPGTTDTLKIEIYLFFLFDYIDEGFMIP